jgi:CRP/FNR family cyclic AMP-dependent transcriptional regulator
MRACTFEAGEVIALAGDPCQAVYLIAEGWVRVRQFSSEGREHVLAHLGPGACLNLAPAMDGGPVVADADALSPVVVYALPCDRLHALMATDASLSRAVAETLAAEVRRLSSMARDLALHTVRARLARFLLTHAESTAAPRYWTQDEIAAAIGTVRDVVGRTLRAFAVEGLVRRERGRLVVADRRALEREADRG